MLNSINLLVYSIILLPFLTILPVSVSLSNTTLNVIAGSHSDSDKIGAIDPLKSSSSLSWNDINDFVYQLQDIDLAAIGDTKFDLVVMDYSSDGSDSGKYGAALGAHEDYLNAVTGIGQEDIYLRNQRKRGIYHTAPFGI